MSSSFSESWSRCLYHLTRCIVTILLMIIGYVLILHVARYAVVQSVITHFLGSLSWLKLSDSLRVVCIMNSTAMISLLLLLQFLLSLTYESAGWVLLHHKWWLVLIYYDLITDFMYAALARYNLRVSLASDRFRLIVNFFTLGFWLDFVVQTIC